MAGARVQPKAGFRRQAILILLPVIVLAVIGFSSVRQDKLLVRRDAVDRAQIVADELASQLWTELTTEPPGQFTSHAFEVDANGQLIFPPPHAAVPEPKPLDLRTLDANQARLWRSLQSVGTEPSDLDAAIRSAHDFIASNPPENFAASAQYHLGVLLEQRGSPWEAAQAFDELLDRYPNAVGESGLPLATLAQFKLLAWDGLTDEVRKRFAANAHFDPFFTHKNAIGSTNVPLFKLKHPISVVTFCSNIVSAPTPLTPYFFNHLSTNTGWPAGSAEDIAAGQIRFAREYHALTNQRSWNPLRPPGVDGHKLARLLEQGTRENVVAVRDEDTFHHWQVLWDTQEESRELFATARRYFHPPDHSALVLSVAATDSTFFPSRLSVVVPSWLLSDAANDSTSVEAATARKDDFAPQLFWFRTPAPVSVGCKGTNGLAPQDFYIPNLAVEDQNWLAVRDGGNPTSHWFICHSEAELGWSLRARAHNAKKIPDYLGVSIEIAGRQISEFAPDLSLWNWVRVGGKEGQLYKSHYSKATDLLASALKGDAAAAGLKVNVFLTSPAALFQRQRARAFWFGGLVLASTAAALIGLAASWRGFRRQQALVEMKSNFVSSVSHELRAPIASVRLLAESLERGAVREPSKQSEYFRFIVQECRRLSGLIENVLDFSRIEQGRKQYEFEPTDLAALARETVRLMEPYAAEKGVALRFETSNIEHPTSNIELNVDGRAIQQALVNLIDNAVKHSPKGETVGIEVRGATGQVSGSAGGSVPASHVTPDTSHVALSVTDHGPGIPREEHEKIFERFYRLGSELRRETQGVGIGLSIVQHIVEAHGGRVLVESEVGKGSRFTIEFPATRNHE